jgi:primosomal protein N' (replication factor Y) (superfamily II helicase)
MPPLCHTTYVTYYLLHPLAITHARTAELTYHAEKPLLRGQIVEVTVGTRKVAAIVMGECPKPTFETKAITRAVDSTPLPSHLIGLHHWMSTFYATHPVTTWQTMLPRGLTKNRRISTKVTDYPKRDRTTIMFTDEQQSAIDAITSSTSRTSLLHGVTGSGKTAVYIELIRRQQAAGKSSIILVPEIALTSQLIADILPHFPSALITHSTMTEAERHAAWLRCLHATEPMVVIGPRSALFSPLADLGLIVIDECHEPTFKQEQSPRYSALRAAAKLAECADAKLVLGSATPSISDYYLAHQSGATIAHMSRPARPDVSPPTVTLVDMTKQLNFSRHRYFSNDMLRAIQTTLDAGHQVLIFHNRRGTAPTTLCEDCGWSAMCDRCYVPLTLHHDQYTLRCHLCNATSKVPTSCPVCHATKVIHKGIGTKMIEEDLAKLFPRFRIARFDGDTEATQTVEKQYQALYDGDIRIIIGTQVVAKGLDLPYLRMVGVVQADSGLALPDYLSSERAFQLIAQVTGRVGRNEHPSQVVVQSYQPTHPAVQYGIAQDYASFYDTALAERKRAHFPPFTHLAKCVCVYKSESAAIQASQKLARQLRLSLPSHADILGPTPAFYERVRDSYRWQIILRSPIRADLATAIGTIPASDKWQTELDPGSLL